MTSKGQRGITRRGQGHEIIAASPGVKRCKRCEARRIELDDGAVRWQTADGRSSIDPPNCTPKSGAGALRESASV